MKFVVETILLGVLSGLLVTMLVTLLNYREYARIYLFCFTLYRNRSLRISMAAILRLDREGRFLLVKNRQRPESYGPFGGVFKSYPSAQLLDRFQFELQAHRPSADSNLENDLRGFLPAKNLHSFLRWFNSRQDREIEPLTREMMEELQEIGLNGLVEQLHPLELRLVRQAHGGLQHVRGANYLQFRYLEVYDLNPGQRSSELVNALFEAAQNNDELLPVTADEIKRGRARNGAVIGAHAGYLLGPFPTSSEPPPF